MCTESLPKSSQLGCISKVCGPIFHSHAIQIKKGFYLPGIHGHIEVSQIVGVQTPDYMLAAPLPEQDGRKNDSSQSKRIIDQMPSWNLLSNTPIKVPVTLR